MDNRKILVQIILAVFFVNAAGLVLRHFNLDSYIILAGFRFHLSLVLPIFFIFKFIDFEKLKQTLLHPAYNKTFQPLGWIFLPIIILLAVLFFFKKIEIGDPDYFYEFGLSSVVDYPIYFVWNFPQLLTISAFLVLIQPSIKSRFTATAVILFSLFAFEFIPLGKAEIDVAGLLSLLFASVLTGLLVKYFQNIYWLSIIIFTAFWANLLSFGSSSPVMIHTLFASQYESWDGFFETAKNLHIYLLPFQLFLTAALIYLSSLRKSRNV